MSAVWYRFRAELRTRWRAWLGLALLVGVASGAVMALVAGARRTESSYDRFLRSQRAYDVAVNLTLPGGFERLDPDQVVRLPQVAEAAVGRILPTVRLPGGAPAITDPDGRLGIRVNRFKILEGRAFDPDRADEMVVGFEVAERLDLHVGDRVGLTNDPVEARAALEQATNPVELAYAALDRDILSVLPGGKATIVGIEASPGEFPPFGGDVVPFVHLSPALARRVGVSPETALLEQQVVVVRLERGAVDLPAFEHELERLSGGRPLYTATQTEQADGVRRSIHLQAVALQVLAGLTFLASILILGQLLARAAVLEAAEYPTLAALGTTRRQRLALGILRAGSVALVAVGIAVGTAVAASPLLPWGLARIAEPDAGVALDATVLFLGGAATLALVMGLAVWPAWRAARVVNEATRPEGRARPSRVASALAGAGVPAAAVGGVRMALERGRGRSAVPVRSTLTCLTLGVLTLVAALTFAASLSHLLDTPSLYGVRWDAQVTSFEGGVDLARDAPAVLRARGVVAMSSGYNGLPLQSGGVRFDAMALDPIYGDARPPIVEGRQPAAPDEIALGTRTLGQLGVGLGDTVDTRLQGGPTRTLRVVGRAVIPPVTALSRFGDGAVVTLDGARRLFPGLDEFDAPSLYLALSPGVERRRVVAALERELELDPDELTSSSGVERPSDVLNFGRVERMPLVLAAILAGLAAATLAHVLVSAVRRHRRDLALLKTLGFVRRQVSLTVASQATAMVLAALAVGVPVGIAVGRWVWTSVADDLGVVAVPDVPLVAVALVVPAAVLLANLIAAVPAAAAARTRPAVVLRSE